MMIIIIIIIIIIRDGVMLRWCNRNKVLIKVLVVVQPKLTNLNE